MTPQERKQRRLVKEFEHKYGMMPNDSQLRQFVKWKESHSGNVWRDIIREINAAQKKKEVSKKKKS